MNEKGIPVRGYRQRMHRAWEERGPFRSSEQWIADQARTIRKNEWLAENKFEEIKRRVINEDNLTDVTEQPMEVDNGHAQRKDDNESSSETDGNEQPSDGERSEPGNKLPPGQKGCRKKMQRQQSPTIDRPVDIKRVQTKEYQSSYVWTTG